MKKKKTILERNNFNRFTKLIQNMRGGKKLKTKRNRLKMLKSYYLLKTF